MGLRLSGAKDGGDKGEGHGAALIRSIEWAGLAIEPNRYTSNAIYVGQIVFIAERQQRQGGVDGGGERWNTESVHQDERTITLDEQCLAVDPLTCRLEPPVS